MNPNLIRQFALATRGLPQPQRARMARDAIINVLASRVALPTGYDERYLDEERFREGRPAASGTLPGLHDEMGQGMGGLAGPEAVLEAYTNRAGALPGASAVTPRFGADRVQGEIGPDAAGTVNISEGFY
ncbi:MAG: hypothetical protein ACOC91_02915, partial [bacterium]